MISQLPFFSLTQIWFRVTVTSPSSLQQVRAAIISRLRLALTLTRQGDYAAAERMAEEADLLLERAQGLVVSDGS